ncbi:MAG: glycerol-3-phosphate 1-O-acyltransferase PlsY [Candidatus Omnitrophica bacterium]|nr:glycerol-3-phosphate 1-O-acyltransferase PlsY [Candidatus Omnitrophota bacterium]
MSWFSIFCWIIVGYFSGSLVWGYWISKYLYGVDIRTKGSGNIGATNVFRQLGPVPGILTFILDVLKGALPLVLLKNFYATNLNHLMILSVGLAAIIGSKFSIFLKGKGGKAVNCSFGVILAIIPIEAIICFFLWILVFMTTGYVSLASMTAAIGLPVFLWLMDKDKILIITGLIICAMIIMAHKENIKRLRKGKENRFKIWRR